MGKRPVAEDSGDLCAYYTHERRGEFHGFKVFGQHADTVREQGAVKGVYLGKTVVRNTAK